MCAGADQGKTRGEFIYEYAACAQAQTKDYLKNTLGTGKRICGMCTCAEPGKKYLKTRGNW